MCFTDVFFVTSRSESGESGAENRGTIDREAEDWVSENGWIESFGSTEKSNG